ncbi:glycosyl transferase family 1, partial [Pseudomonas sp. FW215-L1]
VERGACFDGLHPDRRNANQGAESTLAYLSALTAILSTAEQDSSSSRAARVVELCAAGTKPLRRVPNGVRTGLPEDRPEAQLSCG